MASITILTTTSAEPLTKVISQKVKVDGEVEYYIKGYGFGIKEFSSKQISVENFDELTNVLTGLKTDSQSCVVRGCVKDQVDRTKHTRTKAVIADVDQQWVCIDIDEFPIIGLGCSIEDAPAKIKELLPKCFAEASCFWSFSSSQGYKKGGNNTASIHYWFWLDDIASNVELKAYWGHFNRFIELDLGHAKMVDTVLFDSIQIHYTAAPVFSGIIDVLSSRYGVIQGKYDSVKITENWVERNPVTDETAPKYLNLIGDDKEGFHDPLLRASAAWVRLNGDKRRDEFKLLARDIIDRADKSRHLKDQIDRYKSDYFLDSLLKSAATKFTGQIGINPEARNAFTDYVFIITADKFFKKSTGDYVHKSSFNLILRNFTHMAGNDKLFIDAGGEVVDNVISIPGETPYTIIQYRGRKIYNKWEGRKGIIINPYNADPFVEHIHYLCEGRVNEANALLDYFAFIIANPGRKVHWSPIIGSTWQGTGKSILKIPLRNIFGDKVSADIGTEDIRASFNHYMEKEIVFVEEIYGPDQRQLTNRIKAMITEPNIMINIKNVPMYEVPNYTNIIMFTNHVTPLLIDAVDRRFFFVFSEAAPKEFSYYKEFTKWLKGATNDIFSWATERDLTNFDPESAPLITAVKEEAIKDSVSYWISYLREAKESIIWPLQHDLVFAHELSYALKNITKYNIGGTKMANELKKLGMTQHPTRPLINGSRPYVWIVRDTEKYLKMSGKELAEEMRERSVGDQKEWMANRKF